MKERMRDYVDFIADTSADILFLFFIWSPVVVFIIAMVVAALKEGS